MRSFSRRVDLTSIIGLEARIHPGPSIIDHRTLQNSKQLPLSFLRGIGLPDSLIAYLPSLLNGAIQHYSCFISYSTKDHLQNKGVRYWSRRTICELATKFSTRSMPRSD
jgi:hypothetical protein